jgi:hydrogenase nickel incorporation protein HypA/HybF
MHEAKLCLSLIRLAMDQLDEAHADRILSIRLEVGALSGVVPAALEGVFPICASGTPAEGAALEFDQAAGRELRIRSMEVI